METTGDKEGSCSYFHHINISRVFLSHLCMATSLGILEAWLATCRLENALCHTKEPLCSHFTGSIVQSVLGDKVALFWIQRNWTSGGISDHPQKDCVCLCRYTVTINKVATVIDYLNNRFIKRKSLYKSEKASSRELPNCEMIEHIYFSIYRKMRTRTLFELILVALAALSFKGQIEARPRIRKHGNFYDIF